jgi:hypothetical protein
MIGRVGVDDARKDGSPVPQSAPFFRDSAPVVPYCKVYCMYIVVFIYVFHISLRIDGQAFPFVALFRKLRTTATRGATWQASKSEIAIKASLTG